MRNQSRATTWDQEKGGISMCKKIRVATVVGVALCALAAGATGAYAQATAHPRATAQAGHDRLPGHAAAAAITWNYDGVFRIHSSANGRCLDADELTNGGNGTKVQLWNCGDDSDTNQLWRVYESSDNVFETFRNVASGRWLDADKNTIGGNGTKVQLWEWAGDWNQVWRKNCSAYCTFGTADPGGRDSQGAPRLLDADANTIGGNGTKVQLWEWAGGSNQHWYFELVQAP
jgi:hypothetical protein